MKDEIQIVNRTLRWTIEGITYEADQRHAEIVIKVMNMKKANAVSTPTVPEPSEEANSWLSSPDMTKDEASRFRGLVARVNYLSLDRPDLHLAAKTASQHMAQPQGVRLGQHQADREAGCPKVCVAEKPTQITTYVDSDWTGNKTTRKSTSGGAMLSGKHLIKSWRSTQQVMALSSGEAELCGMLKGATQTKGLISMMADFCEKVAATVCSDASAAIGIAHRQGLNNNPADLLTKAMNGEKFMKYMAEMGFDIDNSRASTAPTLYRTASSRAASRSKQGDHNAYH